MLVFTVGALSSGYALRKTMMPPDRGGHKNGTSQTIATSQRRSGAYEGLTRLSLLLGSNALGADRRARVVATF